MLIDCGPIMRHKDSDSKMIATLAQQTGYWPVFTFFNSMGNLIDLASVGLIGQKGSTRGPRSFDMSLIMNLYSWIECIADGPTQADPRCRRKESQQCPHISRKAG